MVEIKEQITFGAFNSKRFNLFLIERDAPSPESKEIIEDLPFTQGSLDFSMLMGERMFRDRPLTFTFQLFNEPYYNRKPIEDKLKRFLMIPGYQRLYDSHTPRYYWLAKCLKVSVADDHVMNCLVATLEFIAYPFLIDNNNYYDDIWDNINFDTDIFNYTKYRVDGELEIKLYNKGDTSLQPLIIVEPEGPPISTPYESGQTVTIIPAKTYTVRHGDYLYKIAVMYGVTLNQLRTWNNLKTDMLYSGQVLKVSQEQRVITGTTTPVLGEAIYMKIIDGSDMFDLMKGNNDNSPFRLAPGLNTFTVKGTGYIAFHFSVEVMA